MPGINDSSGDFRFVGAAFVEGALVDAVFVESAAQIKTVSIAAIRINRERNFITGIRSCQRECRDSAILQLPGGVTYIEA